jgi:4-amino-4-deoxy-L-arabinose transferase-like glycosyltransferase
VLVYLVLGTVYAIVTPPWQVPDEPAHYNYVRYLVEERRLPRLEMGDYDQAYLHEITTARFDPSYSIDGIRYEFHQPPLYYLWAAPIYAAFGGALLPLRLFSVALGAALVVVAYLVAKAVYPELAWPALGTAALIAFLPQHIAMTAGVENDTLAELLLALILLRLVHWLKRDGIGAYRTLVLTGILIGLALLTKAGVYITVPLALVAVLLKTYRRPPAGKRALNLRSALLAAACLLLPALLIGLPWFVRNALEYGGLDILGLQQHNRVVAGQPRTADVIAANGALATAWDWANTTFHSFWGQFGWMAVPMDGRVYGAIWLFSIVVGLGFLFGLAEAREQGKLTPGALLLGCSALLTLCTYLGYNLGFYQAQGRYLYPALIPIGLGVSAGLHKSLRRRDALLTAVALAVATLVVAARYFLQGCGTKWKILTNAAGAAFYGLRWRVPDKLAPWFFAVPYLLLAALAAASPFWFIRPYLTP